MDFFGFRIGKIDKEEDAKSKSFAIPQPDDGSFTLQTGGHYGDTLDFEAGLQAIQNEPQLINRYREIALSPEGEGAIDDRRRVPRAHGAADSLGNSQSIGIALVGVMAGST